VPGKQLLGRAPSKQAGGMGQWWAMSFVDETCAREGKRGWLLGHAGEERRKRIWPLLLLGHGREGKEDQGVLGNLIALLFS
jgi:hypothetical protein